MIPVKLTLQGLYSYREKQEIDFTRLTQAGLFGIFGSVGSGKSSILEAISFALYGESERLNNRDNRNYNMMNLKSNELLIDFEFKTHDNTGYRFVVKGKRNSKQFDDVRAFTTTAYRFDNLEWVPIDPKSIEQITGLNYKNFRRTIIIPQGKFQEFLQLNPTERTTMLKELFNLDKYELSDKVIRLESANNKLKENIDGQLKGIGEIDPVHLEYLKNEIIRLDEAINTQKQELEVHRKHEQELATLKTLVQKFNKQELEQKNLLDSSEYFTKLESEIKQFESLSLLFHSDLEQLRMVNKNLQINKGKLDQNIEQQITIKLQVNEWQTQLNKLKPEYEVREQLLQTSEELRKVLTIHKNESDISALKVRVSHGAETLQNCVSEIEDHTKKVLDKEEKLEKLRKNLPDLLALTEIKQSFLKETQLSESLNNLTEQQLAAGKALNGQLENIVAILAKAPDLSQLPIDEPEIPEFCTPQKRDKLLMEREFDKFSDHIVYLQILIEAKREEVINCEVQLKLEHFAKTLHDGKPCPLCGSLEHPYVFYRENISQELHKLKAEKEDLESQKDQLGYCLKSARELFGEIFGENDLGKARLMEMKDILKQTMDVLQFQLASGMTREKLDTELIRYEKEKKEIQLIEKEIKKYNDELKIAIENKERFTKAIHDIEKDFVGKQSTNDLLSQQIKLIKIADFEKSSDTELQQRIIQYEESYQAITMQYQHAEKESTTLTSSLNTLVGKIEVGQQNNTTYTNQLAVIRDRIEQKLVAADNLELATVEAILQKQLDTDVEKQRINGYKQQLEACRKALEDLDAEINHRIYNEEDHQQLILLITTLDTAISEMNRLKGENEKELRQLNKDAERYALLKKEYDRLALRGQDITELKNLFRSSGFVNYVSTVYLQNLCAAANDRFYQLTRQKLGLELSDDNSFQVRDYMNEGKLRSVKTLSGGQTFQASLSLALSLADSIHKIAGSSENFFFLDEGFGTLDKESLEVVFESLKALRRENRIVGVISHVEDMQQEIETFLKVVNHNEQGSIVQSSWELL